MNDNQLLQYHRHIMLPPIGASGQETLLTAKILIIGLGGLGSPAALYLAASGIGHLYLNDFDHVDLSNLQRQITHYTDDIGTDKVISTQQTLNKINPDTRVTAVKQRLMGIELEKAVSNADVVLDCTDNFTTRFTINKACVKYKTPLVSGAAIRFEGQVSVFVAGDEAPCYNCLYSERGEDLQNCATNGVISPITGIIGSIQAMETMKIIMNIGEVLTGRLLLLDGLSMQWNEMKLRKNPVCPTCHSK